MATTLIVGSKNYSSWSMRAGVAMNHIGSPYDEVVIPLGLADTRERILRYSAAGLVPILQEGPTTVWDSLAIMEYLAEKHRDAGLWPTAPDARAFARSISAEMHAGFAALRRELPMNCRRRYARFQVGADAARDVARVCEIWRDARNRYGIPTGGDFLFGDFGAADAMFAPVVSRFVTYGVKTDAVISAYVDAVMNAPAVRTWIESAAAESMIVKYELPD